MSPHHSRTASEIRTNETVSSLSGEKVKFNFGGLKRPYSLCDLIEGRYHSAEVGRGEGRRHDLAIFAMFVERA